MLQSFTGFNKSPASFRENSHITPFTLTNLDTWCHSYVPTGLLSAHPKRDVLAWSHKSRAAVDYTPIGVEPHRPTRGVWPIATVANDSQLHLVASSI